MSSDGRRRQNVQVAFSKRRTGLFKKASELCSLTGTELALVLFSPSNKPHSFGSPSVNEIIQRLPSNPAPSSGFEHNINMLLEADRQLNLLTLSEEVETVENQLAQEKKRGDRLDKLSMESNPKPWWEIRPDELESEQVELLKLAVEQLRRDVQSQLCAGPSVTNNGISIQDGPSFSESAIVPSDHPRASRFGGFRDYRGGSI